MGASIASVITLKHKLWSIHWRVIKLTKRRKESWYQKNGQTNWGHKRNYAGLLTTQQRGTFSQVQVSALFQALETRCTARNCIFACFAIRWCPHRCFRWKGHCCQVHTSNFLCITLAYLRWVMLHNLSLTIPWLQKTTGHIHSWKKGILYFWRIWPGLLQLLQCSKAGRGNQMKISIVFCAGEDHDGISDGIHRAAFYWATECKLSMLQGVTDPLLSTAAVEWSRSVMAGIICMSSMYICLVQRALKVVILDTADSCFRFS